jgi:Amt family ammonium transporter
MYPGEFNIIDGVFGFAGFFLTLPEGASIDYAGGGYTYWTDFLFQGMFAATAATIVSGAIAERVKLSAYMVFTVFYVGLVYPFLGSWKWGAGWLDAMNFYDFAGSTLVHSVGGWGALAGIIVIGARLGKYENGKVVDKPGSSVPLAVIGVFLLWLGWFGFNGGSVLSADPDLTSYVLVTTSLAASTGGLFGFLTSYIVFKRMDLGMVLNGILAGLVGITAGADTVGVGAALFIGAVAGVLVVLSAITLDKFKLDDVVGAVSVHLTCGIWGTLAVGIFSTNPDHSFGTQLIGVLAYGAVAFPLALLIFYILKATMGVRVSEEHEIDGLDSHEHGIRGYTIVVE